MEITVAGQTKQYHSHRNRLSSVTLSFALIALLLIHCVFLSSLLISNSPPALQKIAVLSTDRAVIKGKKENESEKTTEKMKTI